MTLWLFDAEVEVAAASERVLFSIDVPRSGMTVYGDQLEVKGWAFAREGPASAVEVRGHGTTRAKPAQPRPDVAAAYPQFPHAGRSGFQLFANLPSTPRTDVDVSIVLGGERIRVATIRLARRAHTFGAPRRPARKERVLALAYPFYRLRNYLHALRISVEQTRDEARANRVELAGHLTRLEALASAQLKQLERLNAAAEAARSSGPDEPRDLGGLEEG